MDSCNYLKGIKFELYITFLSAKSGNETEEIFVSIEE